MTGTAAIADSAALDGGGIRRGFVGGGDNGEGGGVCDRVDGGGGAAQRRGLKHQIEELLAVAGNVSPPLVLAPSIFAHVITDELRVLLLLIRGHQFKRFVSISSLLLCCCHIKKCARKWFSVPVLPLTPLPFTLANELLARPTICYFYDSVFACESVLFLVTH